MYRFAKELRVHPEVLIHQGEDMNCKGILKTRLYNSTKLSVILISTCLTGINTEAKAQNTSTVKTASKVETITVTGSRIRRKDADSMSPLETITKADLQSSGTSSIGDMLQKLPSAGVSLNSNGTQGTSYGASSINLRYLGGGEGSGNRVLVLVDGHRWVDGVGQRGFRDFVDLNTIPFGIIENIEVLKDGASAIYGSDAIAGVVNIHTTNKLDGFRIQTKYGVTSEGDGQEISTSLNWGKNFGSTAVFASLNYLDSKPILTSDRSLTALSIVPVTTPPVSPNGLFILPGLSNNAYFGTASGFASITSPISYNSGTNIGAASLADNAFHIASLPGDFYNTQAQGIQSVGPSKRLGAYIKFVTDVSDNLKFKFDFLYNERKSEQLFSPLLLSIGGTRGTIRGLAIANNQAFNPFGTANGVPTANALGFSASQAWQISRVMYEVGNRDNLQDVKTTRFSTGLDGKFEALGRQWEWDIFGSWAKNQMEARGLNQINYDRLALSLGDPNRCAANTGCVPINIFSTMTTNMADYIRFNSFETNQTETQNIALNLTSELFNLPAGPVSIATGWEYRKNIALDTPDAYANSLPQFIPNTNTISSSQTRTPTSGNYNVNEIYAEFAVPLLKNAPLAKSLDLSVAGRYSNYNTVGSNTTGKVGIGWKPMEGILLRGTIAQGFRAPSIIELFQGARQTNFQGTDPCNGGASANPTKSGCAGIPSTYNQSQYNAGLLPGTISGNNSLKPETARTNSAGITIRPNFLPGLTFISDWYDISIRDAIASQSATQILSLCASRGGIYCDLVVRDLSTGSITNLIQGAQNLNEIKTSGVDTSIRYEFKRGQNRFSAFVSGSYLDSFRTSSPDPVGGQEIIDERAGKGDQPRSTYPHWKGQTSISWNNDTYRLMWRGRFIGETTDIANAVKNDKTAAIFYQDIEAGYKFKKNNLNLTLGISNIADLSPPQSYANAPINYDIYTYDARGRSYYLKVSADF